MKIATLDSTEAAGDVATRELLALADQCVKCGLCLPHCPTFAQTRHEADSPRGRISLIQGWATGELALTPRLNAHLDGCLGCRNCERACPSGVAYGEIADHAAALRVAALPGWRRWPRAMALQALSSARLVAALGWLARRYRRLGLARLLEITRMARIPRLAVYHRLTTAMGAAARTVEAREPAVADFDLFVGCMGSAAQGDAVAAAERVARHLGLRARILGSPLCCGAMLRHTGHPAAADARLAACAQTFGDRPLVGLASACVAELRTHPRLRDTAEICAFLDQAVWPATLAPRALRRRVLVHEPCSHRNQLGGNAAVHRLLARIPGLSVAPLPSGHGCCGAAGTYLLRHPEMAQALLGALLDPLAADPPDLIVTTNPGCALHLAAGIREAGLNIGVRHPIELVAEALDSPAGPDQPALTRPAPPSKRNPLDPTHRDGPPA